jgi:adenylate kinase family enzyme
MRLALLGSPASGKGTQGALLAARYGVRHFSSGRQDDADAATSQRRLRVHHREAPPVLELSAARVTLRETLADQSIEQVTDAIVTVSAARTAVPSCASCVAADSRDPHDPNHTSS